MNIEQTIAQALCDHQNTLVEILNSINRAYPKGTIVPTITVTNLSQITQGEQYLQPNNRLQGYMWHNNSLDYVYLSFDPTRCDANYHSIAIAAGGMFTYIPAIRPILSGISLYALDTSSTAKLATTTFSYSL